MVPSRLLASTVLAFVFPLVQARQSEPRVVRVQPSADEIPANLLRLSIEFAMPVEGPVLPGISLAHADGRMLQEPFLQQELWSPDGRILTLLLHPGRVKTGLIARERLGPILQAGDDVILNLNRVPIRRWHVGQVDFNGPVASAWRLSPVLAASRETLVVTLDEPIDGRDADYIVIVDSNDCVLEGRTALKNGEAIWTFAPDDPWQADTYRLVVRATLEDSAGNRLGGHFETKMDSARKGAKDVILNFEVASSMPPAM